ncbi:Queuine tRNA-ribosyltransferase subunit qtrtd1 [Gryganskiella cystojenkinii]|nr:Queuine tRNA-ribosyltransferase subunit qtrtd1 [Gryganskiella cystojenkinii]
MSPLSFDLKDVKAGEAHARTARLGTLAIASNQNKRQIETPGCFMYSSKGSVPHLTPDNMRLQDFGGVNITLEQILQMDQPQSFTKWTNPFAAPGSNKLMNLADYLHLQDLILLCDFHDSALLEPFSKRASNTDYHVVLSTPKGIRQLTLEDYLKVVRHYRPDIMAALTDSILETTQSVEQPEPHKKIPSEKRIRKSVDRSLKWLDQVLEERQGRDGMAEDRKREDEKRQKREKKQKSRDAKAAAATGTPVDTDMASVKDDEEDTNAFVPQPWTDVAVFAHVQGAHLKGERIRSAQETARREEVAGFIIDTNDLYASLSKDHEKRSNEVLTHVQTSLEHLPASKPKMVYGVRTPEDVLKAVAMGVDLFDTSYPFQLTEDGKASLYNFGTDAASAPPSISVTHGTQQTNRWINLWDDEHSDQFKPILEGCECYACKDGHHTRAYINHLLKTHEMLATVLLMSHNMYQYSLFFSKVRASIQDGTFAAKAALFHEVFGTELERREEKHEAQVVVEAALQKRNQRLETAEEGVMDAIGGGGAGHVLGQAQPQQEAGNKKRSSQEIEEAVEVSAEEKAPKK